MIELPYHNSTIYITAKNIEYVVGFGAAGMSRIFLRSGAILEVEESHVWVAHLIKEALKF